MQKNFSEYLQLVASVGSLKVSVTKSPAYESIGKSNFLKQMCARCLAFCCLVPPPENLFLYSILHKLLRLQILERQIYRPDLLVWSWLTMNFCLPELVNKASGLGRAPGCNMKKEAASRVLMIYTGCTAASLTAGFCFLVVSLGVFETTAE